jgi:hypothetical protein
VFVVMVVLFCCLVDVNHREFPENSFLIKLRIEVIGPPLS